MEELHDGCGSSSDSESSYSDESYESSFVTDGSGSEDDCDSEEDWQPCKKQRAATGLTGPVLSGGSDAEADASDATADASDAAADTSDAAADASDADAPRTEQLARDPGDAAESAGPASLAPTSVANSDNCVYNLWCL